jgi:hypothetical protein
LIHTAIESWAAAKSGGGADFARGLFLDRSDYGPDQHCQRKGFASDTAETPLAAGLPSRRPRAMWSWHAHSWLTSAPNEIGGQVELNRWTRHACESLLDQQGMSVTPEQGEMLRCATEGWYVY